MSRVPIAPVVPHLVVDRRGSLDHHASGPVLCVDGGQTATRAALVAADGGVLLRTEVGPLIHALMPGGRDRLFDVLTSVRDAMPADPAAVVLGLTAITVGTPTEEIGRQVAADLWPASGRIVEGDGIIAWAGATGAQPGVVAMAGTGSVVVAVNELGERVQTGGWSYLFGDPGSGWHIGSRAVRGMLKRWDRDGGVSGLGRAVLDDLGAAKPGEVADRFYSGELDVPRIARLSEVVARVSAEGDDEATAILRDCAAEFAEDVAAALGRLAWEREPVLVATLGRTFRSGAGYRSSFVAALEGLTRRRLLLAEPLLSGLGGAALMGLRLAGTEVTPDLIDRLAAGGLGPD